MRNRAAHIITLVLAATLLAGCSVSKYVGPDQHVLHDVTLDVQMADSGAAVTPEVKDAVKHAKKYYLQRPNTKFLGIKGLPLSKWVYCFLTDTTSNLWNNSMHRIGQAPVIYDEGRSKQTIRQLQQLMDSKGCFGSSVSFDTVGIEGHNISIRYNIKATNRYTIDDIIYHTENPAIRRILDELKDDSPLVVGEPYDQEKIALERSRIASNLREAGYYLASNENIHFVVDTTYSSSRLSIDVHVDSRDLQVYHINNVYIYPNSNAGLRNAPDTYDTLIHTYPGATRRIDNIYVYDRPMTIKPRTISRSLMIFPGMTYRPRYINDTYNSLLGLRNFKYINIDMLPSPASTDSLPLVDAHIRLVGATQQKISLSVELTNASPLGSDDSTKNFFTGGNLGVETAIEYQHKNLFGGAELLRVKGSALFELPKLVFRNIGKTFYDNFSAFEAGLDISLDMPIFLLPFTRNIVFQRIKPHTLFSAGGSYQYRYYFERILANTSFGYTWSHSRRASNQLLPVEMTFVRMIDMEDGFASRLAQINDLRLKYQYSSHFILDARYDYTYSNQHYGTRDDFSALHLSVETAGNLLAAVATLSHAETDENNVRHILGVPFSQYVRAGLEATHYHYFGNKSSLVARLILGTGLPYGNSVSMPYEKSFFGGGPTTMRAWQLRRLGPGSYRSGSGDQVADVERVGDLQLVMNVEGRFPIAGIFEGAVFADMGNVWLFRPSEQYPDGHIKWNSLPTEIAIGAGLGLRVTVAIATLRIDFGIPFYDPGYAPELRWRPPHWRFNQIVTNFGINYPF